MTVLQITDRQVRTVLLHHVAQRVLQSSAKELRAAGLESARLRSMRRLSVHELERLAALRTVPIGIVLDTQALEAGLRSIAMVDKALEQEAYFVRHGASWRLMSALFRLSRKTTYRLRRQLGVKLASGRTALPEAAMCERITRCWASMQDLEPRPRYRRLHEAFPAFPIIVLEAVIRQSEAWK
jgi:hypothetical protein